MDKLNRKRGFTIVELLIVIVVIGILAAVTVVAYSNVQVRATDSRMMAGVTQAEKAIYMWYANKAEQPRGGWGSTVAAANGNCVDGSGGWFASGTYACAFEDALASLQLLPSGFTRKLPPNKSHGGNSDGLLSMMFYPCTGAGRYALYYHLLNPSAADTANLAALEAAGCPDYPRVSYGMKAAKLIVLN